MKKLFGAGQRPVLANHAAFNLKETLAQVVAIVEELAAKKGVEIEIIMARKMPAMFRGHSIYLRELLQEMLTQAIASTNPGTGIKLLATAAREPDGACCVSISMADAGDGSTVEYAQARASYFQQLAHRLNGSVQVKNWPGIGQDFVLSLLLEPCGPRWLRRFGKLA